MKRQNWLLSVAILVFVTMLLTGCVSGLFGASSEAQIREFLKQVETAMKNKDAEKLANFFSYPIEEKKDNESRVVYKDAEALKDEIERGFDASSKAGTTTEDFKFDLTQANINIGGNGKFAAIENATMKITLRVKKDDSDKVEQFEQVVNFELKKVGKQWKFTGDIYGVFIPQG